MGILALRRAVRDEAAQGATDAKPYTDAAKSGAKRPHAKAAAGAEHALAEQQQQHDRHQHEFHAIEPDIGLLPAFGADRLVHRELFRDVILGHRTVL